MDNRIVLANRLAKIMSKEPYNCRQRAMNKIEKQIKDYDAKYNIWAQAKKDKEKGEDAVPA